MNASAKASSFGAGTARSSHTVGHVAFDVTSHPANGMWFGLRSADAPLATPHLFSGPVTPGMASELRALADYLDSLTEATDAQG